MTELEYSNEAQNILNLFHDVDYMVYVEGKDDIPFWEIIFSYFYSGKVEIQDTGCSNELRQHADKIINNEINAIIACDSDYNIFNNNIKHNRIIKTYGYSIENTLINQHSVAKVVKTLARIPSKHAPTARIDSWFNVFFEKCKPLIIHDIYNYTKELSTTVMGGNHSKFSKSKNSPDMCEEKIKEFLKDLNFNIDENFIDEIQETLKKEERELHHFIRGHFLFSATQKLTNEISRSFRAKASISNDALFSSLILAFESSIRGNSQELTYYRNAIKNIIKDK